MTLGYILNHHVELDLFVFEDQVGLVETNHWLIGWDWNNTQLVGGHELGCFGFGGTGHSGQLLVEPEVVLQSDGSERLVLSLDGNAFFSLN